MSHFGQSSRRLFPDEKATWRLCPGHHPQEIRYTGKIPGGVIAQHGVIGPEFQTSFADGRFRAPEWAEARACSHYWGGWRCERKFGQTRRRPKAVAGPTVEDGNEVWADFRRNPKGRSQFSRFRCHSSLQWSTTARSSLLELGKTGFRRRHPNSVNRP
jgi:hypothetical protein